MRSFIYNLNNTNSHIPEQLQKITYTIAKTSLMFLNEAILRNTYAYDKHFIDVKNRILVLKTIICFREFDKDLLFFLYIEMKFLCKILQYIYLFSDVVGGK